jgi:hypothetical protein
MHELKTMQIKLFYDENTHYLLPHKLGNFAVTPYLSICYEIMELAVELPAIDIL